MPSYSKFEIVLISFPFSDLSGAKVRPAVVVSTTHTSQDLLIVPLTSKTTNLLSGEFILTKWKEANLNVETAVKRGIYTIKETLVKKRVGESADIDAERLAKSLRGWLDLP